MRDSQIPATSRFFQPLIAWGRTFRSILRERWLQPYLRSQNTPHRAALGTGLGIFVGLLPLVGIQTYLVILLWAIGRYLLRIHLSLPVAVAMVWITNPFSLPPLFYLYYLIGTSLLWIFPIDAPSLLTTLAIWQGSLGRGVEAGSLWAVWLERMGIRLLLEYGWPVLLGSLVCAIPAALLSYAISFVILRHYRMRMLPSKIPTRDYRGSSSL